MPFGRMDCISWSVLDMYGVTCVFSIPKSKGSSIKYVHNKNPKFQTPLSPLCTPVCFQVPPPPAYVRTFNIEYYPLIITQNRKSFKTSKFLEIDFLNLIKFNFLNHF